MPLSIVGVASPRGAANLEEEVEDDLDLEKVDEPLKLRVAQTFFFLGITYRSLNMHDDAILSY